MGQRTYHECLKENSRQIFATTSYGTSRAYVPETKTTKSINQWFCVVIVSILTDLMFSTLIQMGNLEISNKASKKHQANKHCV